MYKVILVLHKFHLKYEVGGRGGGSNFLPFDQLYKKSNIDLHSISCLLRHLLKWFSHFAIFANLYNYLLSQFVLIILKFMTLSLLVTCPVFLSHFVINTLLLPRIQTESRFSLSPLSKSFSRGRDHCLFMMS